MGFVREEEREKEKSSCLFSIWRICNFFMTLFFALASYVQINDPDAGFWMAAYAVPAALCVVTAWRPSVTETLLWRRVADLHMMLVSAVASILGWTLYREHVTHIFQQEEGREFSGLLVVLLWLLLSRRSGRAPVGVLRVCAAVAIATFPFASWIYYHGRKELRSRWPAHCNTAI
ncbi:unnamed protein product [Ophioblennius macclurei]